jgi:hypothetical protein
LGKKLVSPHRSTTGRTTSLGAQKEKMDSEAGRLSDKTRKSQVERQFADSKLHRDATRLHCRGLRRAKTETGLLVLAQNALTLHNLEKKQANQT